MFANNYFSSHFLCDRLEMSSTAILEYKKTRQWNGRKAKSVYLVPPISIFSQYFSSSLFSLLLSFFGDH